MHMYIHYKYILIALPHKPNFLWGPSICIDGILHDFGSLMSLTQQCVYTDQLQVHCHTFIWTEWGEKGLSWSLGGGEAEGCL